MDALLVLEGCMRDKNGTINQNDLALLLEIGFAACGVKKHLSFEDVRHLLTRARARRKKQIEQEPISPPKFSSPLICRRIKT
jgi:hypothetical protein